ncbi:MAG: Gfo/Idh/MocA family oxidoreductase [Planctomycetaceae bacterium]|nr:Gfo/Idh/MocA family oxidoreductase [Planctomycetaceae bacterium]
MSVLDRINVGIVGVCGGYGRGGHLVGVFNALPPFHVQALCDVDRPRLDEANKKLGVAELYYDYQQMLEQSDIDAVFIATPMDLHVPQAVAALKKNLHVLCEVTAAVSIDQCKQLVAAAKNTKAQYMLASNYNYHKHVSAVRQMALAGLFGQTYYAEGGYVADCKGLAELTPWRRRWQVGINGISYITHNLGPMLQWLPGRRVAAVCCSGSGHHYADPRGVAYEAEDNCTMLGKLDDGGQIVIRCDFLSNRPGIGVYNDLQGTDGAFETRCGAPRIWLKSRKPDAQWLDYNAIEGEFLPEYWKKSIADADGFHNDHFMVMDFRAAIQGKAPNPLGVHESMDLTLPGLVSQLSIAEDGRWIDVPDSRTW